MQKILLEETNFGKTKFRDDWDVVESMKKKICYTAYDYDHEFVTCQKNSKEKKVRYELPDGKKIKIGNVRFRVAETLFKPNHLEKELKGIHSYVKRAIDLCDYDVRRGLYQDIVLSGGNMMYEGIDARLTREIKKNLSPVIDVSINQSFPREERMNAVWVGGSILSTMSTFKSMWVSQAEYEEFGTGIVHRKCF